MSEVVIDFPEQAIFTTDILIEPKHINAANHVGNHLYIDLCNKVVSRYYRSRGEAPYTVDKQGMINTEYTVKLKSEAKLGDILRVELAMDNFHCRGCDFIFRFINLNTQKLVVLAKLSLLTFNYESGKVVEAKTKIQEFFALEEAVI